MWDAAAKRCAHIFSPSAVQECPKRVGLSPPEQPFASAGTSWETGAGAARSPARTATRRTPCARRTASTAASPSPSARKASRRSTTASPRPPASGTPCPLRSGCTTKWVRGLLAHLLCMISAAMKAIQSTTRTAGCECGICKVSAFRMCRPQRAQSRAKDRSSASGVTTALAGPGCRFSNRPWSPIVRCVSVRSAFWPNQTTIWSEHSAVQKQLRWRAPASSS